MPPALPPALPAAARPRRLGAALGLAVLVVWLHGLLFGALAPRLPQRAGPGAEAPLPGLLVRTLPAGPGVDGAAGPAGPAGSPGPIPAITPIKPAAAQAGAVRAADGVADRDAPPAPARPTHPAAPRSAAQPAAEPVIEASPTDDRALPLADSAPAGADALAAAAAAGHSPADPAPAAAPPPVYATRIPAPVHLRYALRYNGQAGEATLDWRHDGRQYMLALDGRGASQPLVVQASRGGFDAAGLAPERFTDRRRGRSMQAANFRRDIGRIGFSGPASDHPAWPGAQDRLSWLPQFAAIRAAESAARPGAAPSAISLFVVDARGAGALWHFEPAGEALLDSPMGPLTTQRWRREPPRPEGLRVEAWLDPARGHWPVLLQFTALRSGDLFELRLVDEPAAP